MIRNTGHGEAKMKDRNRAEALVLDIPSSDLERARRLIMISLGLWICVGILAALQGYGLA
jgi:hypothetical protein